MFQYDFSVFPVRFQQKLGRIYHNLELIQYLQGLIAKRPLQTTEFSEGFFRQQDTLLRTTVRDTFKADNGGNVIDTRGMPFTVIMDNVRYIIPAGIVSHIYMGAFLYNTAVEVSNGLGFTPFYNVGCADPSAKHRTRR